jgi:hypothetical protein
MFFRLFWTASSQYLRFRLLWLKIPQGRGIKSKLPARQAREMDLTKRRRSS